MATAYCGSSGMSDSKVEIIARLAQWRIENFGPCSTRRSDAFKLGIWNWYLSVEKNRYLYIRLYPEPCKTVKDLPPLAKFVLRVSSSGPGRRHCISAVQERMIRNSEDFVWAVEATFPGRFVIDVEFLDLKIPCSSGSEHYSVFPNGEAVLQAANDGGLTCLSRMLEEEIHADVTINTSGGGALKAHKAVLCACSPVFESMFLLDLKEKESSLIDIEDMSLESCSALLRYIYGAIDQELFIRHRLALLAAANKYDIAKLKDCCEESLIEDINCGNVLDRLHAAWLYQLNKLRKACLMYLFDFGKIYDMKDDFGDFFRRADRELIVDMFHEMINIGRPT